MQRSQHSLVPYTLEAPWVPWGGGNREGFVDCPAKVCAGARRIGVRDEARPWLPLTAELQSSQDTANIPSSFLPRAGSHLSKL